MTRWQILIELHILFSTTICDLQATNCDETFATETFATETMWMDHIFLAMVVICIESLFSLEFACNLNNSKNCACSEWKRVNSNNKYRTQKQNLDELYISEIYVLRAQTFSPQTHHFEWTAICLHAFKCLETHSVVLLYSVFLSHTDTGWLSECVYSALRISFSWCVWYIYTFQCATIRVHSHPSMPYTPFY